MKSDILHPVRKKELLAMLHGSGNPNAAKRLARHYAADGKNGCSCVMYWILKTIDPALVNDDDRRRQSRCWKQLSPRNQERSRQYANSFLAQHGRRLDD